MKHILATNDNTRVQLAEIRPSAENPRGTVKQDASFERLVSSIKEAGILVPLVLRRLKEPIGEINMSLLMVSAVI